MKYPSRTVGLFQAAGIALYIGAFAFTVSSIETIFGNHPLPHPAFGIAIFLMAFVISATLCSSMMFAYPATLFFGGKKEEAVKAILWSLGWLALFFAVTASSVLLIGIISPAEPATLSPR